jgi:glycosyltransferase involved in cell wall biosynthesis
VKVVIATPTLTKPHPANVDAGLASVAALDAAGFEHMTVFETGCPYISAARATMLRKALDAKADAVVFIDHDLSWEPQDLVRLIETEGDVVAGTYRFKKDEEEYMAAIDCRPDGTPVVLPGGYLSGVRVPAGFLKVTKEAVDRFMKAFPELVYGPAYNPSVDLFNHGAHQGVWYGEDYAFSRRWRECGGQIVLVPDLDLTHHGDKAYPGNFHRFLLAQPGGSEFQEAA